MGLQNCCTERQKEPQSSFDAPEPIKSQSKNNINALGSTNTKQEITEGTKNKTTAKDANLKVVGTTKDSNTKGFKENMGKLFPKINEKLNPVETDSHISFPELQDEQNVMGDLLEEDQSPLQQGEYSTSALNDNKDVNKRF